MASTVELKRWQKEGAEIVTNDRVFGACPDLPVKWKPRKPGDRKPWVQIGKPDLADDFRFTAGQLKAVVPNGGGPWSVGRLLKF